MNVNWQITFAILIVPGILMNALLCAPAHSHENDNPLLTHVMIEQLEVRDSDENTNHPVVLEAQAWIGKDLQKFWLKADIERHDGVTEDAEIQALYSQAISPYWDTQIGIRHDQKPAPTRDWIVIGAQGIAPYWFDVDGALFIGKSGHIAARFSADYELLLTQRLILVPTIEINFYGQNDAETGTGSGLSDAQTGLRLRYEIKREFAPYVGINWSKKFGNAAEFLRRKDEATSDAEFVAGLRIWF